MADLNGNVAVWWTNIFNVLLYTTKVLINTVSFTDFYARQHICYSAYMLRQFCLSVYLSVLPSVHLSHVFIVSKRLNISKFFHYLIGPSRPSFYIFVTEGCCINMMASPLMGRRIQGVAIFDQYAAIFQKL